MTTMYSRAFNNTAINMEVAADKIESLFIDGRGLQGLDLEERFGLDELVKEVRRFIDFYEEIVEPEEDQRGIPRS